MNTDSAKGQREIISFSLESLQKMKNLIEPGDYSVGECFFAHRDLNSADQYSIFRYPCRINAYIAILCTEGSARIISNLNKCTIRKNNLFINNPNNIIQLESLDNCKFFVVALNDDFIKQMKIDFKKVMSVYMEIHRNPLIEITEEETGNLEEMHNTMLREIELYKRGKFFTEIMMNHISLAAYKTCSIISRSRNPEIPGKVTLTNRNEDYYNRFVTLLGQNFMKEHTIGFYASEICITPKYLASLVKKISGKSATQWINEFVTMEAKHLLKYSKMTIQEISFYLSFPNQSFFTQYFKRQTGMTPTKYRITP